MSLMQRPRLQSIPLGGVVAAHAALFAGALLWQFAVKPPQLQAPMVMRLVSSDQAQQKTTTAQPELTHKQDPIVQTTGASEHSVAAKKPEPVPEAKPTPMSEKVAKVEQESEAPPAPAAVTEPKFDADYLNNPAPDYPPVSRRLGEEGSVLLRVVVSPQGTAQSVEVATSSGYERLDNAARRAVSEWRFVPAQRFGKPVAASVRVPVVFTIRD